MLRPAARSCCLRYRLTSTSLAAPSPLLPFLYSTRSISLTPPYVVRPHRRREGEDIPFERPRQPAEQDSSYQEDPFAYLYTPPPGKSSAKHLFGRATQGIAARDVQREPPEYQPFTLRDREYAPTPIYANNAGEASTLTLRERQVFSQVFEDLLRSPPPIQTKRKPAVPRPESASPLTRLIESALGSTSSSENELTFSPNRTESEDPRDSPEFRSAMEWVSRDDQFTPSLRSAAARAAGLSYAAAERERRRAHFVQGPTLNKDELKDAMSKGEVPPEEVARQTKIHFLMAGLHKCQTDAALYEWMDTFLFLPTANESQIPPAYDMLLASAMERLLNLNDFAGVMHCFNTIKRLGPESYITGASSHVYNIVLRATWASARDLRKIEALLAEMEVNGVDPDKGTVSTVDWIAQEADDAVRGRFGEGEAIVLMGVGGVDEVLNRLIRWRAKAMEGSAKMDQHVPLVRREEVDKDTRKFVKRIGTNEREKGEGERSFRAFATP